MHVAIHGPLACGPAARLQRIARPCALAAGDGHFTVAPERAWTVVDPEMAARRLQHWLATHGRDPVLLNRLRLVPVRGDEA